MNKALASSVCGIFCAKRGYDLTCYTYRRITIKYSVLVVLTLSRRDTICMVILVLLLGSKSMRESSMNSWLFAEVLF